MFTAALFTAAKTRKQPDYSLMDEYMTWHTYTTEYCPAMKKNETRPSAATWMGPEVTILSEVSQKKTGITPTWNLKI